MSFHPARDYSTGVFSARGYSTNSIKTIWVSFSARGIVQTKVFMRCLFQDRVTVADYCKRIFGKGVDLFRVKGHRVN